MQHLDVSGAVRLIYRSLGVKGLNNYASTGLISAATGVLELAPRWDKRIRFLRTLLKNNDDIFG